MAVAPIRPREPLRAVRTPNDDAQAREIGAMVIDAVNALSARVNAIDEDVLETRLEVFRIGRELAPPVREKEASIHEYDPALASLRRGLKKAAVSKDNPLTEADLTRLVDREVDKVLTRIGEAKELGAYRRVRAFFLTGIGQAVSWGWKAAVFGVLGYLAHKLFGH